MNPSVHPLLLPLILFHIFLLFLFLLHVSTLLSLSSPCFVPTRPSYRLLLFSRFLSYFTFFQSTHPSPLTCTEIPLIIQGQSDVKCTSSGVISTNLLRSFVSLMAAPFMTAAAAALSLALSSATRWWRSKKSSLNNALRTYYVMESIEA